jgi:hypothetical protein
MDGINTDMNDNICKDTDVDKADMNPVRMHATKEVGANEIISEANVNTNMMDAETTDETNTKMTDKMNTKIDDDTVGVINDEVNGKTNNDSETVALNDERVAHTNDKTDDGSAASMPAKRNPRVHLLVCDPL